MQNRKRDTDVQNRLLDSVGEGVLYFYASFLGIKIFNHLESTSGKEFQHSLNIPWVMLLI